MGMIAYENTDGDRLLQALAEQLKVPFIRIARQAELAQLTESEQALFTIEHTADMALRLIDGYLLSLESRRLPGLELEPVSITAALQDTAHELTRAARQHNCLLEVRLAASQGPVMAHRRSLESALSVLGYAMIEALPQEDQEHRLVLGSHRSRAGVVAGVFGDHVRLTSDAYRRARALYGSAKQAAPGLSAGSGVAFFVADALLQGISSPLRIARHDGQNGLAATFFPSKQLQLI